jgi:hypothetical protein
MIIKSKIHIAMRYELDRLEISVLPPVSAGLQDLQPVSRGASRAAGIPASGSNSANWVTLCLHFADSRSLSVDCQFNGNAKYWAHAKKVFGSRALEFSRAFLQEFHPAATAAYLTKS